jgi:hypothetical protein
MGRGAKADISIHLLWSAVTCYRFGLRRPVAVVLRDMCCVYTGDGGDRSPNTKAVTGPRTPK